MHCRSTPIRGGLTGNSEPIHLDEKHAIRGSDLFGVPREVMGCSHAYAEDAWKLFSLSVGAAAAMSPAGRQEHRTFRTSTASDLLGSN